MAHDPSHGYADFFAADATLMPTTTMDASGPELYGLHAGMEMLGMRGLGLGAAHEPMARGLSSKAVLVDGDSNPILQPPGQHLNLFPSARSGATGSSAQQEAASWLFDPHPSWQLRSSRFLHPTQQLLQEFCSLPVASTGKPRSLKPEEGSLPSSSSWSQTQLQTMDTLELQKLKAKLYSMLEEVDRRYRRYCEQMRALVGSFEAVAGERAAAGYTALASQTISRHFRCLRDGIVAQIQAAKRALGEKDTAAPGMTKGETPRLKVLDQCLRQQKALHQAGMESHPWRPQRGLPERAVSILRAWLFEHFLHPYPSDVDKHILARQTGLSRSQVSNWFINARVRLWKPMVEEMYLEEIKDQDEHSNQNSNPNSSKAHTDDVDDQKPTQAQLLHDSGSLASIMSHRGGAQNHRPHAALENFGLIDHLDFDPYDQCASQSFGTGVSLTLGLQQHDAGGVNIAFAPPTQSGALAFTNEQMEAMHSAHDHQFAAAMEGEASQSQMHYRNLSAGVQLLHDLAG